MNLTADMMSSEWRIRELSSSAMNYLYVNIHALDDPDYDRSSAEANNAILEYFKRFQTTENLDVYRRVINLEDGIHDLIIVLIRVLLGSLSPEDRILRTIEAREVIEPCLNLIETSS